MSCAPDFKTVKKLSDKAVCIDITMKKALDSQRNEINEVKKAADEFFRDKLKRTLEDMSIDMLSQGKQGIRVSVLKNEGIDNIYQLSLLNRSSIEAINGIGTQGADKIYSMARQIVDNTKAKLSLRINADAPSKADDALIRALYILIERDSLRKHFSAVYEANHRPLQKELSDIKCATGSFKWFMASKKRKEGAINAIAQLESRMSTAFGDTEPIDCYCQTEKDDISVCRAHFRDNSALYYSTLEKYCKYLDTAERSSSGLSDELLAEIEAHPIDLKYLKATLRGYQTFGVKYALHQKRTLLGDEMGLGKTVQAIASIAALKAAGKHHFMVVCPASVLINWCREIKKFSTLSVIKIHGADEEALYNWRVNGDVAVTTYESISRFSLPEKFRIDMLVVDEAHYVKNPEAQRTEAMLQLLEKAENVLYMSGTPLVNRVDEMCFLVKCLQPNIASRLEAVKNVSTAEQFRQELSPVYLRRVREDVLKELPELIEKEQWCALGTREAAIYRDAVASGNLMAIRQVSWQTSELRDSSKAMRLLEICENAKEQGRKIIVFSFFRNTIDKVRTLMPDRCSEAISGDVSPAKRQEIIDSFNAAPEGAVLVSQVQAGGTGLNIQAASVVVFCEPQLTPAIENQAIARAYRMGQTRDVLVYRLLADDTVDERMLQLLQDKQTEFESFADDSVMGTKQLEAEANSVSSRLTQIVNEEKARLGCA